MAPRKSGTITAHSAAQKLAQARQALAASRHLLTKVPRSPKSSAYVLAGAWKQANTILENSRQALRNAHGVVGHGIGFRVRDGIETEEPCIVVFVRNKKSPNTLQRKGYAPVPKHLSHGKAKVATDVIRLGKVVPQAGSGSIGPVSGGEFGTIGAVAFDIDTRERVAITAMHVSGLSSFGPVAPESGIPFAAPSGGAEDGRLVLGTTIDVDAAKIVLEDPSSVLPPLPVVNVRPISDDINIAVHLFGAVSRMQFGVIKYLNVDIFELGLIQTLLVDIQTTNGDSGSGLLDNSNFLLGFLFGLAPADIAAGLRVFCPAELVMRRLRCSII
jgi:hypothetical protein